MVLRRIRPNSINSFLRSVFRLFATPWPLAAEYSRDAGLSGLIVYSPTRKHRHVRKLCSWRGGNAHCRHRATRGKPGRDLLLPPLSNELIALRLLGRVRPSNRRPRKFHQRLQPRCRKPHAVFLLWSFSTYARSSAFRSLFRLCYFVTFSLLFAHNPETIHVPKATTRTDAKGRLRFDGTAVSEVDKSSIDSS